MSLLSSAYGANETVVGKLGPFEGIAPLLLRLFLAPIMVQAGWNKLVAFDSTVAWFSNSLGLPLPEVMAALAAGTEFFGGLLLLAGLATRWISIPLMATMLVAIFAVHWDNGWLALSDASSWLANDRVLEASERKTRAIAILQEHGNYGWLTGRGPITVLNNGIEFAATYFLMLMSLLFTGGGRFTSADYWIRELVHRRRTSNTSIELGGQAHAV